MTEGWPRVVSRHVNRLSPWVEIVERKVEFWPDATPETYHTVTPPDYAAIVAISPDGRFPLVRQYRPAIEAFTWELPAGMIDSSEPPEETCRRELREETGYIAGSIHPLGRSVVEAGRLGNHLHGFFVDIAGQDEANVPEPGVEVRLVTPGEFQEWIVSGKFSMQIHVGVVFQAVLRGYLKPDLTRA